MKWTRGVIEKKTVWSEGLFTLTIRAPEVLPFEAGQFLQLGIESASGHLHRPYSVASPFGETLDFFIVLVEEGHLTPHLWKMDVGQQVDVSQKAAGSFTLTRAPDAKVLWLLATGTGLAPFIAMLRTEEAWQRYEQIVVVHGVRYSTDLAYQSELAEHRSRFTDRFHYVPIISRDSQFAGLNGRITACIADGRLEQATGLQFDQESCVMMCGNPDMLNDTEALLEQCGLKKHKSKEPGHIVVERYW